MRDSSCAFVLALLVLAISASLAQADGISRLTPAEETRGSIETVREILAPHRTQVDISNFLGAVAFRCTAVPKGATICAFRLSRRDQGWSPLAAALDTGDRLNLVCEFPADEAPRSDDSCSVHSQRSNREYYSRRLPGRSSNSRIPASITRQAEAELSVEAQQTLAGARTAFELSTLVGDAPADCQLLTSAVLCTWKTTAATCGHGTLAMSINAPFSKKVRMSCSLPPQGSGRSPDSCSVRIGS